MRRRLRSLLIDRSARAMRRKRRARPLNRRPRPCFKLLNYPLVLPTHLSLHQLPIPPFPLANPPRFDFLLGPPILPPRVEYSLDREKVVKIEAVHPDLQTASRQPYLYLHPRHYPLPSAPKRSPATHLSSLLLPLQNHRQMFSVQKSPICHHGPGIVAQIWSPLHRIPPTREPLCRHQKTKRRWIGAILARSRGA